MGIKKLKRMVNQLEKEQVELINSKELQNILAIKRDKHNELATSNFLNVEGQELERKYQNGYADGLQEAMNTVVGLLDEKKSKRGFKSLVPQKE